MRGEVGTSRRPRWWPTWLLRFPWVLVPFPVAFIQMMGIRFVAFRDQFPDAWNNTGGDHFDGDLWSQVYVNPLAIVLGLVGPLALFAARGFPRTVVAVTGVVTLGYYALAFLPQGPVFLSLIVALLAWLFKVRSERNAQARVARQAQAQQRAGAERLRIAQELHDLLAHHISLINVQSGVALHLVDEKPEQTRVALAAIKGASKEALTALRGALDTLRGGEDAAAPRSPTDGLAKLDAVVDSVRAAGVDVDVAITGTVTPLEPLTDLAALRIVQESLTNVLRHANAGHVDIRIDYGQRLTITVTDDGTGGVPIPGNGLTGMTERATAVGGTCVAGPAPGGGFEVRAQLPGA